MQSNSIWKEKKKEIEEISNLKTDVKKVYTN